LVIGDQDDDTKRDFGFHANFPVKLIYLLIKH